MAGLSIPARLLVWYGVTFPDHPRKWWLHDRLLRLFHVAVDSEQKVVRNDLTWFLNPADYTDAGLFWLGLRDSWDISGLKRLVRPGSVILDVGANFGYYSLVLASALERRCRVIAIEPAPANFARLKRHIAVNGMADVVEPHQMAVSDCAGEVDMTGNPHNSGHTMIATGGEITGIKLTTLDDFCRVNLADRLDLLILDVEGCEERALRGAETILRRFKPVVFVELFPPMMKKQGSSPEAVRDLLTDAGYRLFAAQRDCLVPLHDLPTGDCRVYAFCFPADNLPDGFTEA